MKPLSRWAVILGLLVAAVAASGCRSTETAVVADGAPVAAAESIVSPDPMGLSETDGAALAFLREEEKLAHDVYVTLFEVWSAPIFENIAASETTHTEAVAALLSDYGIADPAAGNGVGEFTDPDLQALYTDLIEQGRSSLTDALLVGAYIEEMDILDLQERASAVAAIDELLGSLERGSSNHLRAFVRNLEQAGVDYVPELMPFAQFDEILTAGTEAAGAAAGRVNRARGGPRSRS